MIDEEARLYFSEATGEELAQAEPAAVIMMYADFRVKPEGIVSYRERVDDLQERYGGGKSPTWYTWTQEFEKWIRSMVAVDPETISEKQVRERWDELLETEI